MISCKLMGGIGNQLFQIAATYALALRNNDNACFDLSSCHTPNQGYSSKKYKDNILSKINNVNNYNFRHTYNEPRFGYEELPYTNDLLLTGYFQSELYFNDYKYEIIDLFEIPSINKTKVKEDFIWWDINDKPITSIHIRRGDYLNHPDFHPVCGIEYYEKAISEIGDSYFVFISDDMDWVRKNFKGRDYVFPEYKDEILDLTVMMMCDNNIISNSSFSWWGAYLNKNENKKVVTPKNWFGPLGPKDTEDIIPKDWVIL